jgi:hypothetical protein
MSGVRADLRHALRVTTAAHARARKLELEVVRLVAGLAGDAAVKIRVGVRLLVARAALARYGGRLPRGMCVVAPRARAARVLRMRRLEVLVTVRTCRARSRPNVVRRVAIRARVVRRDAPATEDGLVLVARRARERLLGLKVVRLVAVAARRVSSCEECGGGHDGSILRVAWDAGR